MCISKMNSLILLRNLSIFQNSLQIQSPYSPHPPVTTATTDNHICFFLGWGEDMIDYHQHFLNFKVGRKKKLHHQNLPK